LLPPPFLELLSKLGQIVMLLQLFMKRLFGQDFFFLLRDAPDAEIVPPPPPRFSLFSPKCAVAHDFGFVFASPTVLHPGPFHGSRGESSLSLFLDRVWSQAPRYTVFVAFQTPPYPINPPKQTCHRFERFSFSPLLLVLPFLC